MFRSICSIIILCSNYILLAQSYLDSLMFGYVGKFWSEKEYIFVQGRQCEAYGEELNTLYKEYSQNPRFIVKYEDQLDSIDLTKHLNFFGPVKSYKYLTAYLPSALTITNNGFKFGEIEFNDSLDAINLISSDGKKHFQLGNSINGVKSLWTTAEISQYLIMQNYAITHHGFLMNDEYDHSKHYNVWSMRKKQLLNKSSKYYTFYYDPVIFIKDQNLDSLFRLEDQKLIEVVDFFNLNYSLRKIECFLYKDLEQKYYLSATPGFGNPFTFAFQNHSVGFAPVEHETIHILFDNQVGVYSTFFAEGIVGYYYASKDSSEWKKTKMIVSSGQGIILKDYLINSNKFGFSTTDYAAAAFFAKFLIDTYGLDKFKSFFMAGSIEKGFLSVYEKSIDQILEEWNNYFYKNKVILGPGRKIIIKVITDNLTDSSEIYITGDNELLGNWNPAKIAFEKQDDGSWRKEFTFPEGTIITYKITRGSWDKEALDEKGIVPQNSVYEVNNDDTIILKIDMWKDQVN